MNTDLQIWYDLEKEIQKIVHLTSEALRRTDPEEVSGEEYQHLQNVRQLLIAAMWYLGQTRSFIIESSNYVV